jgi:hypothetical protein
LTWDDDRCEVMIISGGEAPTWWCDTKSLVASGLAGWRADDVGDVAPGQCSRPVSALTCVAGNGGVRSSEFKPKGSCSIRGPQVRGRPDG